LQPRDGELVRTKRLAGAFSRTDLDGSLRALGVDTLVCAGIMTHLALDSSVRDAAVLGYRVLVAGDACATRALPSWHGDGPIDAEDVHRTALAALADRFADVRTTDALVAWAVGG
jgi:nicotinamidase-related amidase